MNLSSKLSVRFSILATAAFLGLALEAQAVRYTVNFDAYTNNTIITTQYLGVTFSATPQSCGGSPVIHAVVRSPNGGTSSGTHGLGVEPGCPDMSPDWIRMVFDTRQSEVSFMLGETAESFRVRTYSTAEGGLPILTTTITLPGTGSVGVHRLVRILSATTNILRVEVESVIGNLETIDDVTFDYAATPPDCLFTHPTYGESVCGSILINGLSCDTIDGFEHDILEYMPVGGTNWTEIDSTTTPQCGLGEPLYVWNTETVTDGFYLLRITSYNDFGQSSSALTMVQVASNPPMPIVSEPITGHVVGGVVNIIGTASCGAFDHYHVDYKPVVTGGYQPVDPAHTNYTASVTNGLLASWDTRTVPDDSYDVRVQVANDCGHVNSRVFNLHVDNTAPTAVLTAPVPGSTRHDVIDIRGTASDAHLDRWNLYYTDGNLSHGWVLLTSSTISSNSTLLFRWNTTGLPPGPYCLRLLATDDSVLDSYAISRNQSEYLLDINLASDALAEDRDADGMPDLWEKTYGFDPQDPSDAALDADGDGQSNLAEYLAGTDPLNKESVFRITAIAPEKYDVNVTWTTSGSHHYLLQNGTNLSQGITRDASPILSVPPGGASTTTFRHTNAANRPEGYYRVRLVR